MKISEMILPEFEHEMDGVRKILERVPEDKPDWKPHEKSMGMMALATHLAQIPGWTKITLEEESFDVAPPGKEPEIIPPAKSHRELMERFSKNLAEARAAISNASDETFSRPWSLLLGGKIVFTMPKLATLRSFVLYHAVHHRAQLGVYLRMNDIPVPSIYGPSADDNPFE